jgi:predicted dithiol-disulfide oxidoreductase (DUF899 family)
MSQQIVSRETWLIARRQFLEKEKELTRMRDELSRQRRALPWVRVDKDYVFDAPDSKKRLAELFDRRSQLIVYHFMLAPASDHLCAGCAFLSDHVDAARQHFEHNDLSFAAISRAPIEQILAVKKRMGWRFNWVSSFGSDFNFDYQVSFTQHRPAEGKAFYNYEPRNSDSEGEAPGISVFVTDGADVFHTYSSYARGGDLLIGAYNWLDLAPQGRNETTIMDWVRLHDEYERVPGVCCRH